jgi:hypothetical protein
MKHLLPKLIFIAILVLGISSFVVLKNTDVNKVKDELGNTRFNSEMDNGFEEREARY